MREPSRREILRAAVASAVGHGLVVGGAWAVPAGVRTAKGIGELGSPGEDREWNGLWEQFETSVVPYGIDLVRSSGYATSGLGAARYVLDPDQRTRPSTRFRRRSANGRWFRIAEPAIGYTMAGARGDGQGGFDEDGRSLPDGGTDDTVAIQALYDYLGTLGGGTALVEARQFNVSGIRVVSSAMRTVGLGRASHIHTIAKAGRPAVFLAAAKDERSRLTGLRWENIRVSGGAAWGASPFDFNGVLCGYGIQTKEVDDLIVRGCFFDHLSNSGLSIERGARALVEKNVISEVGQGLDIFFESHGAQVTGNELRNVRVFAGINIEGKLGRGHPTGVIVKENRVDGAVTSGIDVIEAPATLVFGNSVAGISGDHPHYPGYSFGIQAYGSPRTRIEGNRVSGIDGSQVVAGRRRSTGIGITVGANSSDSEVVGNRVRDCSRAACLVTDTNGTAVTTGVLVERNDFDTGPVLEGNVSLRRE